ncbi:hypothetical protein KC19_VG275600 [Ceratodon purpureus]|uniref:PROP1-like PPR domain-containing protein n=1 Tax=Ceratodon purpureus TaxID=3225 RepID=A0A8T0HV57_CERPU|nr:hypothetical protein KC19_VG275600 [Ceratodon purpureus]
MRGRWQRHIQSARQSLSWLRASQERVHLVEYDGSVRQSQEARTIGIACGARDSLAQSCRPWIRVYSDRIVSFAESILGHHKPSLEAPASRLRSRGFCTSSIDDEQESNQNDTDDDPKLRREQEQEEIVRRFESLLPKWSSNTPLLLNDLQVQLTPALVIQVVKRIPKSAVVRKFFKWAGTQPGYHHDVYTYAALLDHYGKDKNFAAMDQVVGEMKEEGCAMGIVTFTSLMFWHSQVKKLAGVRRVWNQMLEAGCKPNEYTYSYYIDALAKAGCHEEAMAVFQEMQDAGCHPNIFTYSVVILCLVETLQLEAACELYDRIRNLSFTLNSATYSAFVKAHAKRPDMEKAVFFYREMMDAGFAPSQSLRSLLSEALTSRGRANEAEELTQISSAMAVANLRNKELEAALQGSLPRPERLAELLRDWGRETELALERVKLKMRHPYLLNVLTLVSDDPEVAWRYFEWVRAQENYNPTRHMFARVLDIVGKTDHKGLQNEIISEVGTPVEGNAVTYEKVIKSYCISKHTDAALLVFERMKEQGIHPDATIHTMLIDVLSRTRDHTRAMEMYASMLKAKCKPTVHTYTVILHSLARSGRVKSAITLFEKLPSFGVPPSIGTYTILLKACLKAGELERVLKLYARMRSDGILPSRATHRMVTRGLHAGGMHDEADALAEVPIYFPDPDRGVVAHRTPRARKSVTTNVSRYYEQ